MRVADLDLLFIPESGGLSPDHWIARWSAKLSTARLVPTLDPLATPAAIAAAAASAARPVLLIGHSTGAVAAALAAPELAGMDVRAAFLVAPPDEEALPSLDGGVWPAIPRERLPFPATLVASRTDPWASLRRSQALAQDWGATFIDAGEAGRLDAESGHGPWPDGLLKLGALLKTLA
jgi:predicted alpha/beta hydrolase family esterase